MVNPHVDNGVPWSPKPPSTNTSVSTGTPNFGGVGTGGNNQTDNQTDNQTNNQVNNQVNNLGITTLDDGTISVPEVNTFSTKPDHLSNIDDNIWELATQAYASNPGYEKSFEGQKLINQLAEADIFPGDPRYQQTMVQAFGLPSIISTSTNSYGDPIYTDDGNVIMSGIGQHLLDNYNNPTGSYDEKVQDYYDIKEANAAQQSGQNQNYGYGYDYGPGSSSGYGAAVHPLSFMRGRGRGKQIDTAMLDPRMGGIDASQTASNMLMQLGQGSKAFAMDPNTAGILAMLQG